MAPPGSLNLVELHRKFISFHGYHVVGTSSFISRLKCTYTPPPGDGRGGEITDMQLPRPQALIKNHKLVHRDEQAQVFMGLRQRKLRSA
jgi:hypothetical protein